MPVNASLISDEKLPDTALVVRLEDLVRTNLSLEGAFAEVRRRPLSVVRLAAWRAGGRTNFGEKLAASGAFDAAALPYDEGLVDSLRSQHQRGRKLVLSYEGAGDLAEAVAQHLGIFSEVVAPSGGPEALAQRWPSHERAAPTKVPGPRRLRSAIKALRPHQWTKNALIFLPAMLGHTVDRPDVWTQAILAFFSFSLCASSVYVLNDLLDLHADRAHHHKRNRPFASGLLPLGYGLVLAPALLVGSAALALLLPSTFGVVLSVYYVATLAYSLVLKRLVIVDVLVLAGLYTVRLIAGGVAYDVKVSQWLLAFSLFLFLSLAFVKRYSEVHALRKKGLEETRGRGYRAGDLEQLSSLGGSAGFIAVLVLALYINSADVTRLYTHPERLWGLLPLLMYWVSRVWLLAHRGQMHDDPIVFAIRDRVSYVVMALVGLVAWLAV